MKETSPTSCNAANAARAQIYAAEKNAQTPASIAAKPANLTITGAKKYDSSKSPMNLIEHSFLIGLADVLGFGAEKYGAHNWRDGFLFSRLLAASYRHLGAFNSGEDLDPESGLSHIHHLACCVMFLSWMAENRSDLDDRWKGIVKELEPKELKNLTPEELKKELNNFDDF